MKPAGPSRSRPLLLAQPSTRASLASGMRITRTPISATTLNRISSTSPGTQESRSPGLQTRPRRLAAREPGGASAANGTTEGAPAMPWCRGDALGEAARQLTRSRVRRRSSPPPRRPTMCGGSLSPAAARRATNSRRTSELTRRGRNRSMPASAPWRWSSSSTPPVVSPVRDHRMGLATPDGRGDAGPRPFAPSHPCEPRG